MAAFVLGRLSAQDADTGPEPSCALCPADYVPAAEIAAYEQVAMDTGLTDLQTRSIDDRITYLMVRVDPDKVVPLLDAAGSQAYLAENGQ